MRVLLLNPPFRAPKNAGFGLSFPLGLGYLSTALKKAGIDVVGLDGAMESPPFEIEKNIIHYGLKPAELRERIKNIKPDVVGISCFFSSRFPAALEAAQIAKEANPAIITVTGGVHPSLMPKKVCAYPEFDFAVIGEGERSFVQLVTALENNGPHDSIDGLAFKRENQVCINPKTNFNDELDSLGYPDWELFNLDRYLKLHEERWGLGRGRYAPMVTSRGCPFHCTFCSIHQVMGPGYRVRSAGHVIGEIETLISKYAVDEISFEDDNLTYDKDRFSQICQGIIEKGLKIRWNTPNGVHVGSLDDNALRWAKKAGCDSLNLAIESGDVTIRNRVIKKGLNSEKIYEVAKFCHKMGIKPNAYFVIGMPGETDDSINNTRRYINDLHFNNLSIFVATPTPGTKFYEDCVAIGYIKPELFENEYININAAIFTQPSIETPEFDRHKIALWRYRLITAYYDSCLKHGFINMMITKPRIWLAMVIKVLLYKVAGERLSFMIIKRLQS
jgi:anaerobic magnesium-protoporphyrin IX monomethyl ester cyclase